MFQKHHETENKDVKPEQEVNKNNEPEKDTAEKEVPKEHKQDHHTKKINEMQNEIEKLKQDVADKIKQADDNMELAKRIKAEFENYKKRVLKEYEENMKLATEEIIKDLLSVLMHFKNALKINNIQDEKFKSFYTGVELIEKELKKILTDYGLKEIAPQPGEKFDPNNQEAVMTEMNDKHEEGTILETVEIGYQLSNKLIKPAKVKVSKSSKKENIPS